MKFTVRPVEGGGGRLADRIAFVGSDSEVATAVCPPSSEASWPWEKCDGEQRAAARVDDAAEVIARMLHRYRDYSLVVNAAPGYRMRGDEHTTEDVYPPGKHPAVHVHG